MKIKAGDMKPGMVIAIKRNKTFDDVCLMLARTGGKGDMDIEYTHLDLQDSYGGALVGTINGNQVVEVYKGKKRKYVIEKIKDDLFSWRRDVDNLIDMIALIEAMSSSEKKN